MSTTLPPVLGPGVLVHKLGAVPEPDWLAMLILAGRVVSTPDGYTLVNPLLAEVFTAQRGDWLCHYTAQDRLVWSPGQPELAGARHYLETNNPPKVLGEAPPAAPDVCVPGSTRR